MNKCDVTITKKMTINTGNYSSIQPSVSITMKDIYVENIEEAREDVENITSAFFIKEMVSLSLLQDTIKGVGINKLLENIDIEQMEKDTQESVKKLSGMAKF